jgi:hypothetical protein
MRSSYDIQWQADERDLDWPSRPTRDNLSAASKALGRILHPRPNLWAAANYSAGHHSRQARARTGPAS